MNVVKKPVIIFTTALLLWACSSEEEPTQTTESSESIKAVKTLTINGGVSENERILSGITISSDEQTLSFRVAGTITELPIDESDIINKGDLVAKLDASDYNISLQQARASLAQARASEANAISSYERTKELYAAQAASLSELEAARANSQSAKAGVAVAQQQVSLANNNAKYTSLTSESDNCTVTNVMVTVNSTVNAGTPIATLSCGNQLHVRMTVPESLIDELNIGQTVVVKLPSINDAAHSATIVEKGASTNNTAGFQVEAQLNEEIAELRVGVAATVGFSVSYDTPSIILPVESVLGDDSGRFVFVLTPSETENVFIAKRRPIENGDLRNDGIEVTSGLQSGDEIIISGASKVRDGMHVKRIVGEDYGI